MKDMNTHQTRILAALAAAASLSVVLSGCSLVDELAHKMRSVSYDTAAELADEWEGDAPWLPADATGIRIQESTMNDTAVILASSSAELDTALCAVVPRRSAPAYQMEGAPNAYKADTVFACGVWAVVASDDGWFGWNPSHPEEQKQSPAS